MADEKSKEATTYSRDRLVAEANEFLGYPPHVVAGALHDVRKQNLTVDETKNLVNKWLAKPVGTEEEEEA